MAFPGLPDDLRRYLADLEANNDRAWFDAHRDRYEASWLQPAIGLCEALAPRLATFDPPVTVDPRVNGSIWRIQRDTRFSPDKTPYKTHLGFRFWYGDAKKAGAGFYLAVHADRVRMGAGFFGFDKPQLAAFRQAAAGPAGAALLRALAPLEAEGWQLGGEALKRVPKPWAPDHPHAALLVRKHLFVGGEPDLDDVLGTPAVVDAVAARFARIAAVPAWVQEHVLGG